MVHIQKKKKVLWFHMETNFSGSELISLWLKCSGWLKMWLANENGTGSILVAKAQLSHWIGSIPTSVSSAWLGSAQSLHWDEERSPCHWRGEERSSRICIEEVREGHWGQRKGGELSEWNRPSSCKPPLDTITMEMWIESVQNVQFFSIYI